MKLYLSSFKIGKKPQILVNMLEGTKVAYINNGQAHADIDVQKFESLWDMRELREAGLTPEVLNLRDYFGKQKQLKKKLESFDGIYVGWGSTFNLRLAMKLSGFDNVIQELRNSDIVYAWFDAGANVVWPDLNAYNQLEQETYSLYGDNATVWEGLGLTPWYFVGHIDSEHELSAIKANKLVKYYDEHNLKHKKIRDGEFVLHEVKI